MTENIPEKSQKPEKPYLSFKLSAEDIATPKPTIKASEYIIDPALHRAVEVAILLKQPLLLTGEPGTGKTRLAEKLADDLFNDNPREYLNKPLVFHTKTISSYTDLFYNYDALAHFHDAHFTQGSPTSTAKLQASDYIQLQALGQAIVLSDEYATDKTCPYKLMEGLLDDDSITRFGMGPRSSVVLIDEVDKAPRDFTNDLLNELDRFEFFVKEDHNRQFKKGKKNTFLILTSNSEKNLPDAFLRRCIFYHIKFPDNNQLQDIVFNQLFKEYKNETEPQAVRIKENVASYVNWFSIHVRDANADKKPATAELISWMNYLSKYIRSNKALREIPTGVLLASFSILAKEKNDLARLNELSGNLP